MLDGVLTTGSPASTRLDALADVARDASIANALAAAREAGVALPVTGLIAQLIAAARAQGYGSLDHSVLLKVLENVSGKTSE